MTFRLLFDFLQVRISTQNGFIRHALRNLWHIWNKWQQFLHLIQHLSSVVKNEKLYSINFHLKWKVVIRKMLTALSVVIPCQWSEYHDKIFMYSKQHPKAGRNTQPSSMQRLVEILNTSVELVCKSGKTRV